MSVIPNYAVVWDFCLLGWFFVVVVGGFLLLVFLFVGFVFFST